MPHFNRLIIVLLAVLITLPVLLKSRSNRRKPASAAFSVLSSTTGYYQVTGDVRHPGIYPITANMVTTTAIQLAEPLEPVRQYLSTDSTLQLPGNGTSIHIKYISKGIFEASFSQIPTPQKIVLGIPLNINTLRSEDLDLIPGVGPVIAQRIIQYRQANGGIMSPKDLINVEGIGDKKYNRLVKYFN